MKNLGGFVLSVIALLAMANTDFVSAQPGMAMPPAEQLRMTTAGGTRHAVAEPQELVVCTGWHALCTASTDCKVTGDRADCDCLSVDETHIVMSNEIQDAAVKQMTQAKCTDRHPCDVDEAPVCGAIRDGRYKVAHVKYDWVSTYSYRGWCGLLPKLKACDLTAAGYAGDREWAICDAAPCTEIAHPSDPNKPLTCQCRVVREVSFVGMNGSCIGDHGGIMSSMSMSSWDFQNNTYPVSVPGYEYVEGACAGLSSDQMK